MEFNINSRFIKSILILTVFLFALNVSISDNQDSFDNDNEFSDEDFFNSDFELTELDSMALKPRFGLYGAYILPFYSVDMQKLPGTVSCCPGYSTASGMGAAGGLNVELPFNFDFGVGLAASYSMLHSAMNRAEVTSIILDNALADAIFEHRLRANLSAIDLNLYGFYYPAENLITRVGIGVMLFASSDFQQQEYLIAPENRGTFSNGFRTQNFESGEIQNLNKMLLSANIGFGYQLPLNSKLSFIAEPRLDFSYLIGDFVDSENISWSAFMVKAGLSIMYRQPPPPPPPPPPPIAPPFLDSLFMPVEPPQLFAEIDALQINEEGKPDDDFNLQIEDFVTVNMRPLLTYVFFDENSSELPERYVQLNKEDIKKFDYDRLTDLDPIRTYYHVLNIIGKRLAEKTDVKVTLVGCNSNFGDEKNNKTLSMERAETVMNYFTQVWNIEKNRFSLVARNLPQQPSRIDTLPGREENQRVEILTSDPTISEPALSTDTLRIVQDTKVKFVTKAQVPAGIKNYEIKAYQGNREVYTQSGYEQLPHELVWEIKNSDPDAPRSSQDIVYFLSLQDSLGQSFLTKPKNIEVDKISIERKRSSGAKDKEFEYYSLILFDYGKSNLGSEHRKVVDFVKSRVAPNSIVRITGHSDSMGKDEINKKISEKRAKAVAERLNIRNAEYEGLGKEDLIFKNDSPEGRFYCRTVRINIETPIE